MEYSEHEKLVIAEFWHNHYTSQCPKCHGLGRVDNIVCSCTKLANVSSNLEQNGFGRKYLMGKLTNQYLMNLLTNKYLNHFSAYLNEGKGLFLCGPHDTQKTLATTILAKTIMNVENPLNMNSFSIKFFLYDDLVRFSYDDKSFIALDSIIKKTNILVIDSLGAEIGLKTVNKSSVSLLENILRNRTTRGLITWITTDQLSSDIKTNYNVPIYKIINRDCLIIPSIDFEEEFKRQQHENQIIQQRTAIKP